MAPTTYEIRVVGPVPAELLPQLGEVRSPSWSRALC